MPPAVWTPRSWKNFLSFEDRFLVRNDHVAVGFEVDLVDFYLAGNFVPARLQPAEVPHLADFINAGVDGSCEILILARRRGLRKATKMSRAMQRILRKSFSLAITGNEDYEDGISRPHKRIPAG